MTVVIASLLGSCWIQAAEPMDSVRVLSLNNSLVDYNDQYRMFNEMARADGAPADWTKHTRLGKTLEYHFNEGIWLAPDRRPSARMLVRSAPWSYLILQEQSARPRTDFPSFREGVKIWVDYVREHCPNPNAVILLPVNWAYSSDWDRFTADNETLLENYFKVADEFGLGVVPVAAAYQMIFDEEGKDSAGTLYTDNRHPSPKASYLAALMEYSVATGKSPLEVTYRPATVTEEEASSMRKYAAKALEKYSDRMARSLAHAPEAKPVKPMPDWSGLDLVALTEEANPTPDYKYLIQIEDHTGWKAVGAYMHGEDKAQDGSAAEIWGEWPGQAPIEIKIGKGKTVYTFGHNEENGTFKLIFNNWNDYRQLPDFTIEGGRDYRLEATPAGLKEISVTER